MANNVLSNNDISKYLSDFSLSIFDSNKNLSLDNGLFFPDKIADLPLVGSTEFNFTEKIILSKVFICNCSNIIFASTNREIAKEWGISVSSVAHAIGDLKNNNYIKIRKIYEKGQRYPFRALLLNISKFHDDNINSHDDSDDDMPTGNLSGSEDDLPY